MRNSGAMKKIFVVDDEKDIQEILYINLTGNNYAVSAFSSAEEAIKGLETAIPDLMILDIMMSGMDGFEFCRYLRKSSNERIRSVPIIFLSARTDEFDRILGLELGADDYVAKPFSVKELVSRVKAVLRRTESSPGEACMERIAYKGIELYPEKYELVIDGENVKLTKTEFDLLALFMRFPGKVFSRDNIIDSVRGNDVYVTDRTIDVHIMNIRKKLGKYKNVISTLSGVGYGFKK